MTTAEIANRVVELNRTNDYHSIYEELYAPDAVSIENWSETPEVYTGRDAIQKKSDAWMESVEEIHSTSCSEPLIADNSFAIAFTMDVTYKTMGRIQMTELAVYTVKDGKIIKEEFQG